MRTRIHRSTSDGAQHFWNSENLNCRSQAQLQETSNELHGPGNPRQNSPVP